jgi:hypothetical protein
MIEEEEVFFHEPPWDEPFVIVKNLLSCFDCANMSSMGSLIDRSVMVNACRGHIIKEKY